MKNKRLIIILVLLIIVIVIGIKYYFYLKYETSSFTDVSTVNFTGNMTINHTDLKESEYTSFSNIKFKNIFDGFHRFNEEADTYKMVTDNNEKAVFIGTDRQYLDILLNDKEYENIFVTLAKKENIKNDLDLLKYMEKHEGDTVKYLMTIKKQKQIYTLSEFKSFMLPSLLYVKSIDGDFTGYIFKTTKDITEVSLLEGNNKRYYFTFFGDFSEDYINEFMNTVIIER